MIKRVELLEDITTMVNKKVYVYGKKGAVATVIAVHDEVLIVELKERFSVHISKVKDVSDEGKDSGAKA